MRIARPCLLLLAAVTLLLSLTGCGMSQEDRDFYLGGWVRPTDLDRPSAAERRHREALEGNAAPAPVPIPATARDALPSAPSSAY